MGLLPYGGDRRSERVIANSRKTKDNEGGNCKEKQATPFYRWKDFNQNAHEPSNIQWFTHKVLQRATGNFALRNRVGEGQNGSVFHGRLLNGENIDVAVKKLKNISIDPMQSALAELRVHRLLSKFTHPDVRHLIGVSFDPKEPLIVYEFMPKGSLRQHLQGKKGTYLHSNAYARVAIALDVAKALCELHYNSQYPIFHRDVKSSNILLDSNYHAKLADLGIAVVVRQDLDLNTVPLGAFGYKDPLYEQSGNLNDKTDVYSFGVLLMELATHLPAWDIKRPVTLLSHIVLERVKRGVIDQIIQPGDVPGGMDLMRELIKIAVKCCSLNLNIRPRVNDVAYSLSVLLENGRQEQQNINPAQQQQEMTKKNTRDNGNKNSAIHLRGPVFYRREWVVPKTRTELYYD